jgi:hypothetical protein
MKQRQILPYTEILHSDSNKNKPGMATYYKKWQLSFNKLNDKYAKYYSSTEHLEVNDVIVLYKGTVTFK